MTIDVARINDDHAPYKGTYLTLTGSGDRGEMWEQLVAELRHPDFNGISWPRVRVHMATGIIVASGADILGATPFTAQITITGSGHPSKLAPIIQALQPHREYASITEELQRARHCDVCVFNNV